VAPGPALSFPAEPFGRKAPFASPAAAQRWLEWRRHAFVFPLMLALLMGMQLLLFAFESGGPPAILILVPMLGYPLLVALAVGSSLGNTDPEMRRRERWSMAAFQAARPISSAELLGIKLRVAAGCTLLLWVMVAVVLGLVLPFSRGLPRMVEGLGWLQQTYGMKPLVLLAVTPLLLVPFTWKVITNQFWFAMTGRVWVVYAVAVGLPFGLTGLALAGVWIGFHPELHAPFLAALPWMLGVLAAVKVLLAIFLLRNVQRRELLRRETVQRLWLGWPIVAAVLAGVGALLAPEGYEATLALALVLQMPGARLALALLALDSNRHR
jgi:hypothetical protein